MNVNQRYQKLYSKPASKKKPARAKDVDQSAREAKRYYRGALASLDRECRDMLGRFAEKYPLIKKRMILNICEKHCWVEKYVWIDLKHFWSIKAELIGNRSVAHSSDESESSEQSSAESFSPPRQRGRREEPRPRRGHEQGKWRKAQAREAEDYAPREYGRRNRYEPRKPRDKAQRRRQEGWGPANERRRTGGRAERGKYVARREKKWRRKTEAEMQKEGRGRARPKGAEGGERAGGRRKGGPAAEAQGLQAQREEAPDFGDEFLKKENMQSPKSIQSAEDFKGGSGGEEGGPAKPGPAAGREGESPAEGGAAEGEARGGESEGESGAEPTEDMNDSFKLIMAKKTESALGIDNSTLSNQFAGPKTAGSRPAPGHAEAQARIGAMVLKTAERCATIKRIVVDELRQFAQSEAGAQFGYLGGVGHGYFAGERGGTAAGKRGGGVPNGVNREVFDRLFDASLASNINRQTLYAKGVKNVTSNFTINTGMIPNSRRKVEQLPAADKKLVGSSPEIFENDPRLSGDRGRGKAQEISERALPKPETGAFPAQAKGNSLSLNMRDPKGAAKRSGNRQSVG